ncbi:MAG: hypothetical protein ACI4VF_01705 [Lachnospirales bacterium]
MNKKLKILFIIATMYFVIISAVYAYAIPKQKGIAPLMPSTSTTTTETTTESTTETTTEEETETTTSKNQELISKVIEANSQITTVSSFSIANADENCKPFTGKVLEAYNIAAKTFKDKWTAVTAPEITENTENMDDTYSVTSKTFNFDESKFVIKRYNFNKTLEAPATEDANTNYERLNESLEILGDTIEIRYIDPETNEWYMSGNIENTKFQTLFIDTDKAHIIISVPGVYTNKFENNTLEYRPEFEQKVDITKTETGYSLNFSFPIYEDVIGEIWYLTSDKALANWNDANHFDTMKQDLAINRRFSYDGYYFPTPSNYTPYSETMLYRHPSNYVGSSFTRYGNFPAAFDLGYVFTYTCMKNQNSSLYWATGPKSDWLATDFNIGAKFYDTRFNTDFAENLINAYKRYNNDEFLFAATKYCEYFIEHANNKSYKTKNGGILVQDYGYDLDHTDTHISLNHQLAELNFLYKMYQTTREEKYKDLADKMLKGVEDTQDQWVLANNNLNYALYYLANTNTMVDYPYLTYNDLLNTKVLYKAIYGKENSTIEYLLKCKKEWMDNNNVTGYNVIE